ncbi:MAG: helix-turn-helix domain-containing protein, partial [Gammaproteobacteria bacterium]|nr:helix-turn-helix domain-containing protein [Gammaproteobacteria bacterium]
HIRNQGKRILDAAQDLFTTRGYQGTDMADIAESMGLARNSLYRYYSNKDHILVAIVRRDMVPFFDQFNAIEHLIADPKE